MSSSRNKKKPVRRPVSNDAGAPPSSKVMAHTGSPEGEITIFLSYARADDDVYGMIWPFKKLLSHFIYAKSGRKVRAFLDQQDIRWGDIWKNELETNIRGASVFIPMLSAAYLDSENCRMEFNRFHGNATALGVKELLLPVLLIEAPAIFNEFSDDEIVIESAARQWEVIEDAVLSDEGTSHWKRTMSHLADRFVTSYSAAESRLAELEQSDSLTFALAPDRSVSPGRSAEYEEEDDDDSTPGLAELMGSIQKNLEVLTEDAQDIAPAIGALGSVAKENTGAKLSTPQQLQAWSRGAARSFEGPSNQLAESGERMLATTKALDVDLRRLRLIALELLPGAPDLAQSYNDMIGRISVPNVRSQLEGLLVQMKPAEVLSVPLRKALRPARLGLTRVSDSLEILEAIPLIDLA